MKLSLVTGLVVAAHCLQAHSPSRSSQTVHPFNQRYTQHSTSHCCPCQSPHTV